MQISTGRQQWADIAKGLSIVFVVFHHVVGWPFQQGFIENTNLYHLYNAMQYFRMPLFFMAAGLFARSTIYGDNAKFIGRVRFLMYVFILWSVIRYGFEGSLSLMFSAANFDPSEILGILLWPMPSLWFLYALAIFTIIARLTRNIPIEWLILGAVCVNLTINMSTYVAPAFDTGLPIVNRVLTYYVFFLLGYARPGMWSSIANAATWPLALLATAAFFGLYVIDYVGLGREVRGTILFMQVLSLFSGVLICAMLQGTAFGRLFEFVGRHTLPVYLMHVYVLEACWRVAVKIAPASFADPLMIAITALAVGLPIVAYHIAMKLGLNFLFEWPGSPGRARSDAPKAPAGAERGSNAA